MKAWRNTVVRFGLVNVPIAIAPLANDTGAGVESHRFEIATGEQVKQAWTTDGKTLIPRDATETRYVLPNGDAVACEAPELEGAKGVELLALVDDYPAELVDAAYAAWAGKGGASSYDALRDALHESGRVLVGVGRFTDRPRPVVIKTTADGAGLVLLVLKYAAQVREGAVREAWAESEGASSEAERAQARTFLASLPAKAEGLPTSDPMSDAILEALRRDYASAFMIAEAPETDADILATLRADVDAPKAKRRTKAGA